MIHPPGLPAVMLDFDWAEMFSRRGRDMAPTKYVPVGR